MSARGTLSRYILACVAGGMRERAGGGRAAIFLSGKAREEFASGEFNSTLHQSSHGFATRVHGFATKRKALTHEIPPATQASYIQVQPQKGGHP